MASSRFDWHRAADELPSKSAEYIVWREAGYCGVTRYSAKYKTFDANDLDTEDHSVDLYAKYPETRVVWWAEIPPVPEVEA